MMAGCDAPDQLREIVAKLMVVDEADSLKGPGCENPRLFCMQASQGHKESGFGDFLGWIGDLVLQGGFAPFFRKIAATASRYSGVCFSSARPPS